MSIALSMAVGPTPIPRNFGQISNQSMISRSHSEASIFILYFVSPVTGIHMEQELQILTIP
jgi:hypothetical protein